ncbi:FAD-dependent monooxygenase [Natronomonas sp. EA1]|uniref:FAD-dependent monooxygenase n=1 Tax=Natronomonas sp. EA1 TaxID=3421655 RepID=UPI003EBD90FE
MERRADVVIVGAGPGGCTLAALLARSGVDVALLERHRDLSREFRGYLFQPFACRLFDELGLLDSIRALPHATVTEPAAIVYGRRYPIFDLGTLPDPYDYALLMEQPALLRLLIEDATDHGARFFPGTTVQDLVYEGNAVVGLRALDRVRGEIDEWRARLVVGADGRYSTVRERAGIDAGLLPSKLELVWFKLPAAAVGESAIFRVNRAGTLIYFGLGAEEAQAGWFIEKGGYPALRAGGIAAFRDRLAAVDPALEPYLADALPDFGACSLLHIEPGLTPEWTRDGLLLLGDAAHVASPVGGQGNGLAVGDAVAAHPVIVDALGLRGPLSGELLSRYEAVRRPEIKAVLGAQRAGERAITAFLLGRDRIPAPLERVLLRAVLASLPRIPGFQRVRDHFALGDPDLHVALPKTPAVFAPHSQSGV